MTIVDVQNEQLNNLMIKMQRFVQGQIWISLNNCMFWTRISIFNFFFTLLVKLSFLFVAKLQISTKRCSHLLLWNYVSIFKIILRPSSKFVFVKFHLFFKKGEDLTRSYHEISFFRPIRFTCACSCLLFCFQLHLVYYGTMECYFNQKQFN